MEWEKYFYFFHRSSPFLVIEERSDNAPISYPASKFRETADLNGQYIRVTRSNIEHTAYYVFEYFKTVDKEHNPNIIPANRAKDKDFIILSLDQSLSVSSPVLQVEDFQFLIHRGFVATIFISANNISEARQSLSQNNPSAIIQNYAIEPELARTRKFADVLRQKLSGSYKVSDQCGPVTYYCEFTAKVDLTIKKSDSLVIDLTNDDEITETFTEEYKEDDYFKIGQTLAGMLSIAAADAVQHLIEKNKLSSIRAYGVSARKEEAYFLEMSLDLVKGTTSIYKSEKMDIVTAFNYALQKLNV